MKGGGALFVCFLIFDGGGARIIFNFTIKSTVLTSARKVQTALLGNRDWLDYIMQIYQQYFLQGE